jgi:hypothetical protein
MQVSYRVYEEEAVFKPFLRGVEAVFKGRSDKNFEETGENNTFNTFV